MEIAKGIKADEYLGLQLDKGVEEDWLKAISFLEKRLTERYIEPAEILIKAESSVPAKERKYGFTVLAIDCMLLETIQSFYVGLTDTRGKSKDMFTCFLTQRANFKNDFDFSAAEKFYFHFRCGILHQTEIQEDSKVWSVGPLVRVNGNSLIANRNEFHERIKKELNLYIELLKKSDVFSVERSRFRTKMNFICRK